MTTITVFGSAKCDPDSADYHLAYELGLGIGKLGFALCNGGYGGAMEASAKGAQEADARTTGITLAELSATPNSFLSEEIRAPSHWERLQELLKRGDAYVVLKGGTGTLTELACAMELILKGFMPPKPLLVYAPFWQPVIEVVRQEVETPDPRSPARQASQLSAMISSFATAKEAEQLLTRLL